MKTIAGIFVTREEAAQAGRELTALGFRHGAVMVLSPGGAEVKSVPTEDAEQPGMGKALGGVVGGAVGLSAGAVAGALLLPGIGPVLAITFGAAAAAIGGVMVGGAAGGALEEMLSQGVPKDEIFMYEDALRRGHSVLIALSEEDAPIDAAREVLRRSGAETIDAAREKWWIGIREAEEVRYPEPERFTRDEETFRRGFAAALEPAVRGRSFSEGAAYLEKNYRDVYTEECFRRGFERGRKYYESELSPKSD